MSASLARNLIVHGRVQGVFFRAETRRIAQEHGVRGWVANRPDGTVEVWLEGDAEAVAAVGSWIGDGGPPAARVDRVVAQDVASAGHRGFEIRSG